MNLLWSIITPTAVSIFIWFILQSLSKSKIDNYFNKKLESHKHELSLISDYSKFDFQRKIHDFTQFNTKKHEVCPELYRLFMIAHGSISGLRGLKQIKTFQEFDRSDIKEYLENKKVVSGKINEIIITWEMDRAKAVKEIHDYLFILETQNAQRDLFEAQNYFYLSEMYLSESISEVVTELRTNLNSLFIYIRNPSHGSYVEEQSFLDKTVFSLDKLLKEMRKELKTGYYDVENEKAATS